MKESNASGAQLDSPIGNIHTLQSLNGTVFGQRLNCAVRPDSLRILRNGDVASNAFDARVTELVYWGSATECVVEWPGAISLVLLTVNQKPELGKGQTVRVGFDPSDVVVLTD